MRMLALLAICSLAFGCSNVRTPTASIAGMSVKGIDANGFTMNFDVNLTNPNAIALPLAGVDYQLGLGGVNVATGQSRPEGSLPAGGLAHRRPPVTLTYESLLSAEQAIVKSGGDVPYALAGGISVDTGQPILSQVRVPLTYQGTLKLREILGNPVIILQSPAAQKLARQLLGGLFGK